MTHAGDDPFQVLAFVEGRQHDEDLGRGSLSLRDPGLLVQLRNLILKTCLNMSSELLIGLTFVGAELRQTTGTSAILTPCLLARYSTSGSYPKPSVVSPVKTSCATSARKSLKPHCVSQMPGSSTI